MTASDVFFDLIKSEITGDPLENKSDFVFDEVALFNLAKKHDVAHLVSDSLIRNGLVTKDKANYKKIYKEKLVAIYRDASRTDFYEEIAKIFSTAQIEYIPLKGILIRELYSESWMRSSCDLDILIHEEDLEKATTVLIECGLSTDNKRNYHDVSFFRNKNHLELHFNICENNEQLDKLLKDVWNYTYSVNGYELREEKEFFAFHHIAHMAYHFLSGGCGIRPFIDLWLMRQKHYYDDDGLIVLLNECELKPFYDSVCDLIDVWFGKKEHTELTKVMSDYIISGGVYGNEDNSNTVKIAMNKGSKIKYLFKLAFMPYENMCALYPLLRKHRIFLPFCYIHRLFLKIFGKDNKRVRSRIQNIKQYDKNNVNIKVRLLEELNLK